MKIEIISCKNKRLILRHIYSVKRDNGNYIIEYLWKLKDDVTIPCNIVNSIKIMDDDRRNLKERE